MDNFRDVSDCNKSTGLEHFSNDSSIKKRHQMEIRTKKYRIWDWVSKINSRLKNAYNFPWKTVKKSMDVFAKQLKSLSNLMFLHKVLS